MSEDWAVGDLALCVDDSPCEVFPGSEGGIQKGGVYQVILVRAIKDYAGRICGALHLDRHNPIHPVTGVTGFHNAIRFKKIKPLTEEERESFLADLPQPVEA